MDYTRYATKAAASLARPCHPQMLLAFPSTVGRSCLVEENLGRSRRENQCTLTVRAYGSTAILSPRKVRQQHVALGQGFAPSCNFSTARSCGADAAGISTSGQGHNESGVRVSTGISERQVAEPGTVYFVATPIGNLQDMSLRQVVVSCLFAFRASLWHPSRHKFGHRPPCVE